MINSANTAAFAVAEQAKQSVARGQLEDEAAKSQEGYWG